MLKMSKCQNIIQKGWLKSSLTDQDTLMECDQMRFIFQQSLS